MEETDTIKAELLKLSIENFNLKYKTCEIKDLLELLQTQIDKLKRLSNG